MYRTLLDDNEKLHNKLKQMESRNIQLNRHNNALKKLVMSLKKNKRMDAKK